MSAFPMHEEKWRPVPDFEGRYEVSDLGRVRPLPGQGRGRQLKPSGYGQRPYLELCFYVGDHQRVNVPLHRIVCEAFHGQCPEWADRVRHLNDESYDNRAVNLSWGTASDNMQDRTRNGRNPEARRDACDNGHPYVEGSYSIDRGARRCLVCHRDGERARNASKRLTLAGVR